MPIFKEHNLLFIHIPKTGGSAIESYYGVYHNRDLNHLWHSDEFLVNGIKFAPQHFPSYHLKDILTETVYNSLFKFTFVRNPYTRILSEYGWQSKIYNTRIPLNDWIIPYYSAQDTDHKLPQSYFIDDSINYIGKFESLQEDFNTVLRLNNLDDRKGLERVNVSNVRPKLEHISQGNISFINDLFIQDFTTFKYELL